MEGFNKLNKAFESRVRMGVISVLIVNNWVAYKELKRMLNLTDGNLASHIYALEKNDFLEIKKQFIGKKPKTTYRITKLGRTAFIEHIAGLEKLLEMNSSFSNEDIKK